MANNGPHDCSELRYQWKHFNHIPHVVKDAVWDFLLRQENVIRMETATALDRAAVEPLSDVLIAEFGLEVNNTRVKQTLGHMVCQIMLDRGFEIDRKSLRITRPGLFSSGARYRRAGKNRDRSTRITSQGRRALLEASHGDEFNQWLDDQARARDGSIDMERLRAVAANWGVEKKVKSQDPGLARLEIGILLRPLVPRSEYEPADEERHEYDTQHAAERLTDLGPWSNRSDIEAKTAK